MSEVVDHGPARAYQTSHQLARHCDLPWHVWSPKGPSGNAGTAAQSHWRLRWSLDALHVEGRRRHRQSRQSRRARPLKRAPLCIERFLNHTLRLLHIANDGHAAPMLTGLVVNLHLSSAPVSDVLDGLTTLANQSADLDALHLNDLEPRGIDARWGLRLWLGHQVCQPGRHTLRPLLVPLGLFPWLVLVALRRRWGRAALRRLGGATLRAC